MYTNVVDVVVTPFPSQQSGQLPGYGGKLKYGIVIFISLKAVVREYRPMNQVRPNQ